MQDLFYINKWILSMLNLVGSGKKQDSVMKDYFILWTQKIFLCVQTAFSHRNRLKLFPDFLYNV